MLNDASVAFVMEKDELEFEMSSHILLFHRSIHTSRNIMLLLLYLYIVICVTLSLGMYSSR